MSDNIVSTAAEELKKWLEVLEKILSKIEADKAAGIKAKLDNDRFDKLHSQLKGINEKLENAPDGLAKDAVKQDLDGALGKLNENGNKTGHGMGQHKGLDDKFKPPGDDKSKGLGKGLGEGKGQMKGLQEGMKNIKIR